MIGGTPQAVPAHIAENARRLYKDCLRLAEYLGNQKGNNAVLREQVRTQFRANLKEEDPVKIKDQKSAAVRALSNFMFYEAARMAKAERGIVDP